MMLNYVGVFLIITVMATVIPMSTSQGPCHGTNCNYRYVSDPFEHFRQDCTLHVPPEVWALIGDALKDCKNGTAGHMANNQAGNRQMKSNQRHSQMNRNHGK
ncbi:hypothetical protein HDE_02105 [Halotydeus destructor]|nr:hypothetical protein HDE_02105 [Halotydeus destructor]